jgi:hypothetical protein
MNTTILSILYDNDDDNDDNNDDELTRLTRLHIHTYIYTHMSTSFAMEMSYTSLIYIANGAVDSNIIIGWVDNTAKAMPPMA